MEVELHQLTLRYEHLRKRHPLQERALLSSLAEIGQQLPIIVVGDAERWVLIDGYKRVRALKRLAATPRASRAGRSRKSTPCCSSGDCAAGARMRWIKPGCWRSCRSASAGHWRSSRAASIAARVG